MLPDSSASGTNSAAAVAVAESGRRLPGVGLVIVVLVVGGAAAVVAGTGALLRVRRWRRALRSRGWIRGVLRIAGPAVIAFEPEGYDELDPDHEPVRLRLMSTAVWRTRAVQQFDGGEIRAAPVGEREWVLTAEGVETEAQLARVRAKGCTQAQGFLFSRAVPASEIGWAFCSPTPRRASAA